ncbi:MAG: hypothetical protein QW612_03905 [Candidatus Bathyarchaeia archaeon]
MGDADIAILYTIAMGVDALIAFPIGYLCNAIKFKSLYIAPTATLMITLLLTTRIGALMCVMAVLWGVIMGVSEMIMRVFIADIANRDRLAIAYGIFGMLYEVLWKIRGFIITFLLQLLAPIAVGYTVLTQALSLLMLAVLNRQVKSERLHH